MAQFKFTAVLCGIQIEAPGDVQWSATVEEAGSVTPFADISPRGTACDVWLNVNEFTPAEQTITLTAEHAGASYTITLLTGPS